MSARQDTDFDALLSKEPLRLAPPPKDRTFYARQHVAMKWTPYKPGSQEVKRGKMGRWQQLRPYGIGWQNAETQPQAGAWVEDVINNPDMSRVDGLAAAAPALLAALEEIVSGMASDVRKSTLTWGHAHDAFDIAQAAIRAARQQEQSHEA